MQERGWLRLVVVGVVIVSLAATGFGQAAANHAWRAQGTGIPLHWPKTGAEAQVVVADSVASTASYDLDLPLRRANARWKNPSDVIFSSVVTGSLSGRQDCNFIPGQVRVCNYGHGTSGFWNQVIGFTEVQYNPDNGHISRAKVRLNDTYLKGTVSGFQYLDDLQARQEVICHELGHALGLDHQPNSCLRSRIQPNLQPYPDAHDYAQLRTSYHTGSGEGAARSAVDQAAHDDSDSAQTDLDTHVVSVRDAPNGEKVVTFVRRVLPRSQQGWTSTERAAGAMAFSASGLVAAEMDGSSHASSALDAASATLAAGHPHDHVHHYIAPAAELVGENVLNLTATATRLTSRPHPLP